MKQWILNSLLAVVMWGVVGLFQKIGANRVSEASLLVWLMIGLVLLLPWLLASTDLQDLTFVDALIGSLAGTTNGFGLWFLFLSFRSGAKASVAIPLTALNPLLTVLLAVVFLNERLTGLQYLGVALALVSGVLLSCETRKVEQRRRNTRFTENVR
jgi:uncharacterized membrane protein